MNLFQEALAVYGHKYEPLCLIEHDESHTKLKRNILEGISKLSDESGYYFYKHTKKKGMIYPCNDDFVMDHFSDNYLIRALTNPIGKIEITIYNITKKII